jgi:hypothetical protein
MLVVQALLTSPRRRMELSVFRVRVAPLLCPDSFRALRCVSTAWQVTVDQLVAVKGALGLRPEHSWTIADVRFAHANVRRVALSTALPACAGGELHDLQWGLATFLPREEEARRRLLDGDDFMLLRIGWRVTRQECMALLIREQVLSTGKALLSSCETGRLELAQFLAAMFGLTAEDARRLDNCALRMCCANGHLAVAQWLVSTFGLTAKDARWEDSDTLRMCCANGHLAVAQWLVSTFGLTAEDARSLDNYALRISCKNGHLAVAQWLVSTFGLTAADARWEDSDALRISCENGHLAVAQWLVSTFGLTAEDARCESSFAFRCSCENGRLGVAQWLAATFGFTARDAGPNFHRFPHDVARWLEGIIRA